MRPLNSLSRAKGFAKAGGSRVNVLSKVRGPASTLSLNTLKVCSEPTCPALLAVECHHASSKKCAADKNGNIGAFNNGNNNFGVNNTGNSNIGNYNSGFSNIGSSNQGTFNVGFNNSGYGNTFASIEQLTGHKNTITYKAKSPAPPKSPKSPPTPVPPPPAPGPAVAPLPGFDGSHCPMDFVALVGDDQVCEEEGSSIVVCDDGYGAPVAGCTATPQPAPKPCPLAADLPAPLDGSCPLPLDVHLCTRGAAFVAHCAEL